MTSPHSLAALLDARSASPLAERALLVPGVFNALSARVAERAGFECLYLSGTAIAASAYGLPDAGIVGRQEIAEHCRLIGAAVALPLIADADTGYGEAVTIRRTVQDLVRAGASALTLEDQVLQKRCGYTDGLTVVPVADMQRRIEAARLARGAEDLVIIGRTDALGVNGLDDAVARALAMLDAGADVAWILGLQRCTTAELAEIRAALPGRAMVDYTELDAGPPHSFAELAGAGYEIVLVALSAVLAGLRAMERALARLRADGDWTGYRDELASFEHYNAIAGMEEAVAFEAQVDGAAVEGGAEGSGAAEGGAEDDAG